MNYVVFDLTVTLSAHHIQFHSLKCMFMHPLSSYYWSYENKIVSLGTDPKS